MAMVFFEWFAVLLAYWLPGAALLSLIEWRSIGRGARWLAPFAVSIAVTPVLMALPTWFGSYRPNLLILAAFSAVLFLAGFILKRLNKRPVLEGRSRNISPPSRRETVLGILWILLVTGLATLPRLHMLVYGGEVGTTGLTDTYWHIAHTSAIARAGIPPRHFLFPDLPLIYYYYSWIYPAVLGSLPHLGESLLRMLNMHAMVNLLVFLGVLYAFLRMNLRSPKIRAFAFVFLTLAGGFDFFTRPNLQSHEWWQIQSPALVSQVQISAMLTTFVTEPQHVAGATAFLFLLILWRNVRGNPVVRGVLAAVATAFLFGTSAFIFFSAATAAVVWVFLHRRALRNRRALIASAGIAAFFLILAGPQIALTLGGSGTARWGEFRVVLTEAATGTVYGRAVVLDQILTLAAFPLVTSVILLIEIGLPFGLYAAWVFRGLGRRLRLWDRFLFWYPMLYIPAAFLLQHANFSMRGMIPVQIVIVLGASAGLAVFERRKWTRAQRTFLRYGFTIILFAQILSAAQEWWIFARRGIAETVRPEKGFLALPIPVDNAFPGGDSFLLPPATEMPEYLRYIAWVNVHLPKDALLVEINLPEDSNKLHMIERMRLVDPAELDHVLHADRELNIVNADLLLDWWNSLAGDTVWEKALHTEYVLRYHAPVYVMIHQGEMPQLGPSIYADDYVTIYLLYAWP
jgi:hypothetical protein